MRLAFVNELFATLTKFARIVTCFLGAGISVAGVPAGVVPCTRKIKICHYKPPYGYHYILVAKALLEYSYGPYTHSAWSTRPYSKRIHSPSRYTRANHHASYAQEIRTIHAVRWSY